MRLLFVILWVALTASRVDAGEIFADQGNRWTAEARRTFYKADQGSRIMPYEWMAALKQKSGTPFLADSLVRYGYLAAPEDQAGLPVGFTLTGTQGAQVVGMTCSACHTRQIAVGDQLYRIDGGPALVDFQTFLEDLDTSVSDVLATEEKFNAFAKAVFEPAEYDASDIAALKKRVSAWYERYHTLIERSLLHPGQSRWGIGRLDAISMIFNRVTGLGLGSPPSRIIADNIYPADAPARYPFLWNAPVQNRTQWSGFARNGSDRFALSRNVGQVLGVFGDFQPKKQGLFVNFLYGNSVNFDGLTRIEELVKKIGPPKWPWPVDQSLAARGKQIYARPNGDGGCIECHQLRENLQGMSTWPTPVKNDHTDTRQYAVLARTAKSGALKGAYIPVATSPLKETDTSLNILVTSVIGSIVENSLGIGGGSPPNAVFDPTVMSEATVPGLQRLPPGLRDLERAFVVQRPAHGGPEAPEANDAPPMEFGAYEARVLEGIWAAAPYLHNGSVATLAQLLTPAAERSAAFKVGPQYDTVDVGIAAIQPATAQELVTTDCSKRDSGNSRCGHEWGTRLSSDEKKALIEYLKTL